MSLEDLSKRQFNEFKSDNPILSIGQYTIQPHPPIPKTDQVNVIWIENELGEGMSVDIDSLWKSNF